LFIPLGPPPPPPVPVDPDEPPAPLDVVLAPPEPDEAVVPSVVDAAPLVTPVDIVEPLVAADVPGGPPSESEQAAHATIAKMPAARSIRSKMLFLRAFQYAGAAPRRQRRSALFVFDAVSARLDTRRAVRLAAWTNAALEAHFGAIWRNIFVGTPVASTDDDSHAFRASGGWFSILPR
jgi:hypothetical protein